MTAAGNDTFDLSGKKTYYFEIMFALLPKSVDVWRTVSARRSYQGALPIVAMPRLCEALAQRSGSAQYLLDFGRDALGIAYVDIHAQASLWLVCQRTLEPFVMPVAVESRLGMIRAEREEAALPAGYEPLLVAEDGKLMLSDLIEDELLLALPWAPVNPDSALPQEVTGASWTTMPAEGPSDHPFAVLRDFKETII